MADLPGGRMLAVVCGNLVSDVVSFRKDKAAE
jgi:hypothetical protein